MVAYTTTAEPDIDLRKWIVFEAQHYNYVFLNQPSFETTIRSLPNFAVDYGIKYARALFGPVCGRRNVIDIETFRASGFSGLCGRSKFCDSESTART
jgi:hypothetical protein